MKYDFDRVIDRKNTNSSKWDRNEQLFGREDVLDMWVADMEFPAPQPVVEALKERAEHPIYGYTFPPESLLDAIVDRTERYYGWKIKREWIVFTAGVVNGLYSAVEALTRPGDEVIIQPPVYHPFFGAIKNTGRQVLHNYLNFENGRYTMDFEGLEDLFRPVTTFPARSPKARMLILCSPHNPVGRVWTHDELEQLGRICLDHDCALVSDEIHCDLLVRGTKHTATATISDELEQATVTFMSASKTFNLAGLSTSYAIIPNDRWRRDFVTTRAGHNGGNVFGFIAMEAAFRYGDAYVSQLQKYITGNVEFFTQAIEERIPQLKVVKGEGTYLAWVDMRALGLDTHELQNFLRNEARLALDDGFAFGPGGEGFQRFNLACPRSVVEEAISRLESAVKKL